MGLFDRFFGKDEKINDEVEKIFGKKATSESFKEVSDALKINAKQEADIGDKILSLYDKKSQGNIQKEILDKYLKDSREVLNSKLIKKEEIKAELSEMDGIDDKTKEDVAEKLSEKTDDSDKSMDPKSKLKSEIYKTLYEEMYKGYTKNVLDMKNAQFYAGNIALGGKCAVEMIAFEKNLENIEMSYHRVTGKNFSNVKEITKKRDEFNQKFQYTQKGINNEVGAKVYILKEMYQKREARYREYIKALTDPSKTNLEKEVYKKDYEKANISLLNNMPSLKEYTIELDEQGEHEKLANETGVGNKSAIVNNEFDRNSFKAKSGDVEKVSESQTVEDLETTIIEKQEAQEKNIEYASLHSKDQREKGNYEVSKDINDAQTSARVMEENIDQTSPKADHEEAKKEVREEEKQYDNTFFSNLKAGVETGMTEEQAKRELDDETRKKAYEEEQKAKSQSQEMVRTIKKTGKKN